MATELQQITTQVTVAQHTLSTTRFGKPSTSPLGVLGPSDCIWERH